MKEKNAKPKTWISVRVKPEEYDTIYARFSKTTCRKLSEYVRQVLMRKPVTINYRNEASAEILALLNGIKNELHGVAANFNQSTKILHSLHHVADVAAWVILHESAQRSVLEKVEDIRKHMHQLYELWSRK
jgi:hypothetical protein